MSRDARRAQLITAAQEVFARHGYHAAAMDDIADAAAVSKPVLYQHFPGKLELYLAILDAHSAELFATVESAIAASHSNQDRLAATFGAFFEFFDREDQPFRLLFESDLNNDPAVRDRVQQVTESIAALAASVIAQDTALPKDQAMLLGVALTGMAEAAASHWLTRGRTIPRTVAVEELTTLAWRGIRAYPIAQSSPEPTTSREPTTQGGPA